MKNIIETLKQQATVPNGVEGLGGSYRELDPDLFVELIIKECARFADEYNEKMYGKSWCDGEAILQHFLGDK